MNLFELSNDTLTLITSICAIIISVLSLVSTIIFSLLQQKHNKNSVKPISAILLSDYEDRISVKIRNVGTGPLTIKKLTLKDGICESSDLISLMPKVNQWWTTFTEPVDGWTIPVGGELILIEIHPVSDEIKKSVRKALSKITAYLEYTDIYNTKFQDERSFEFFGRHYE